MNPNMLTQSAVQRNFAQLEADGWTIVASGAGHMACGDDGEGRLAEPVEIQAAVEEALSS